MDARKAIGLGVVTLVLCAAGAWAPPAAGQETPKTELPNVASLNPAQYSAAVSWAMEASRRVRSPMTAEQTKAFERAWAPAFGFPCPGLVDYLNKLLPLLREYLAAHGAMQEAAIQFDEAWRMALVFKEYNAPDNVVEAMGMAQAAKSQLVALGTRREAIAYRIKDLGDPPDPAKCRAKRRKQHDDSIKPAGAAAAKQPAGPAWVLTGRQVDVKKTPFVGRLTSGTAQRQDIDEWKWTYTKDGTSIVSDLRRTWQYVRTINKYDRQMNAIPERKVYNGQDAYPLRLVWKRPPAVFTYQEDPTVGNSTMMLLPYVLEDMQRSAGQPTTTGDAPPGDGTKAEVQATVLFGARLAAPNGRGTGESYSGWAEPSVDMQLGRRVRMGYTARAQFRFDAGWWRVPYERAGGKWDAAWSHKPAGTGWTMDLCYAIKQEVDGAVGLPGAKDPTAYGAGRNTWQAEIHYVYTFDPDGTTVKAISLDDEADKWGQLGPKAPTAAEAADERESARTRQERVDFHKGVMRICERNIARWEQELAAETNPERREALVTAILQSKGNWYSEMDRILEAQTGQVVHTRTPVDEYYSARFVEQCRTGMGPDAQLRRYAQGTQRMIALAPADQREQLRAFVARHAGEARAWGDVATMRKISRIVFEKVQGHWEGEGARSLEEAILANRNLQYAQILKTTAEAEMFVATMGMSAMGAGGAWIMPAFEGGVGFAEAEGSGGDRVYHAIEKSLAWTNTAGLVASEAMVGYEKGGWLTGQKGLLGAAERGLEALALVKGLEYGIGALWGTAPAAAGGKPTVQEAFEYARHKQAMEEGKFLVEDYQRAHKEYQRALEFGAGGAEAQALEATLRAKAATIHATYESKLYLKTVGPNPKYAEMIADFNQRLGQVHGEVLSRFRQMMTEKGYDDVGSWVFQEFRNSASVGTVGMDYDIGLMPRFLQTVKEGRTVRVPLPFTRGGLRVSPVGMRKASEESWRKAYQAVTGQSARRSFETMTSAAHPEIYTDLAWLGDARIKGVKLNEMLAERAGQAGDVTGYKAGDMTGEMVRDGVMTAFQARMEAARGMAKDIETKLLPLLKAAPGRLPGPGARYEAYQYHWQQICQALKAAGNDPIRANEQIRLLTGGKEIPELAWDIRDLIANYGKALGR